MQFNSHTGDEESIELLEQTGKMADKTPGEPGLSESDMRTAKIVAAKGGAKM
jgi:hypothetical protein